MAKVKCKKIIPFCSPNLESAQLKEFQRASSWHKFAFPILSLQRLALTVAITVTKQYQVKLLESVTEAEYNHFRFLELQMFTKQYKKF